MDDDYATNPLHGLYEGSRRFTMQLYLGCKDFVTCPLIGMKKSGAKGFLKGLAKGTTSIICRPTAGTIDLVERSFEGLILFPAAVLDSCQKVDEDMKAFRRSPWHLKAGQSGDLQAQAKLMTGSDAWWERSAAGQYKGGAGNAHFSAQNTLRAAGASGMAAGASSYNQKTVLGPGGGNFT